MVQNHPLQDIIVGAEGSSGSAESAPKPRTVYEGIVEGKTTRIVVVGEEVFIEVSSKLDKMGAPIFEELDFTEDFSMVQATFKAFARKAPDWKFPY
ncbi:MAG: hypothetical protein HY986_07805 [Candidatus Melainabacteria bacterium]|nr:hypothetical protein [Candidatus Melainabacteria bacterium]